MEKMNLFPRTLILLGLLWAVSCAEDEPTLEETELEGLVPSYYRENNRAIVAIFKDVEGLVIAPGPNICAQPFEITKIKIRT